MNTAVTASSHYFHDVQKDTFFFRTVKSFQFGGPKGKTYNTPGGQTINKQTDSRLSCKETSRRL